MLYLNNHEDGDPNGVSPGGETIAQLRGPLPKHVQSPRWGSQQAVPTGETTAQPRGSLPGHF